MATRLSLSITYYEVIPRKKVFLGTSLQRKRMETRLFELIYHTFCLVYGEYVQVDRCQQ